MTGPWKTHVDADGWEPTALAGETIGEVHSLRFDDGDRPYEAGLRRRQ